MRKVQSCEEIIRLISDYQYVSFDMFDTLIKRDVPKPTDVFRIIEEKGHAGFCEQRIAAERAARQRSQYDEVTLDEIYEGLPFATKDEEVAAEQKVCTANLVLKQVYDYCRQNKKTILITTDIYLSRDTVASILANCGYSDYDYLFVSSEERCMKANGRLFDVALQRLGIKPNELIHIGDNYNSDCIVPNRKGINTVWINGLMNHLKYVRPNGILEHDYWLSFTNNHLKRKNIFHDAGYECFGPLLYGFVKWLIEKLEADGIEKVYFLSRDGEIVKTVFDTIYRGEAESHYLLVSRRALLVPSLKIYRGINDFLDAYHFPFRFSAEKFCRILGCENAATIQEILRETGLNDHEFFRSGVKNNVQLEELYKLATEKLKGDIDNQYNLLRQYLVQEDFGGKVAIVDIGWHGNMQKNLMRLVESYGIDADISGYYVAMTPSDDLRKRSDMCGYLFDAYHNQNYDEQEQLFNAVFELLFTGSHGTVLDYRQEDSRITSNQGNFEIKDEQSVSIIREYQAGAADFCADAEKYSVYDSMETEYVKEALFTQFLRPDLQDAENWGKIVHDDVGIKPLVAFNGRRYYVFHPHRMVRDYRSSLWRVGFLKRLLVADIPYYKSIVWINKLKKRFG